MIKRVRIRKSVIPSVFTLLNLFFGFLAIVTASQGYFQKAAWLIIAGALFDGLDGRLARFFKVPTKFGVQFDSLADLVSFCTAPAVLVYFAYLSDLHPLVAAGISFVPLLAGGIRLARFNIQAAEIPLPFFIGLPSPANALVISSFVLFNTAILKTVGDPRIALPLVFVLAFLMVSHVPYAKLPEIGRGWKAVSKGLTAMILLAGMAVWKGLVLFPVVILYVWWGLIGWLVHHGTLEVELEMEDISDRSIPKTKLGD